MRIKKTTSILSIGKKSMDVEARSITNARTRLGQSFIDSVEEIANHPGKTVVIGMGKSGLVAQKIVATLCSTGTPAVYLHPADAVHGDLGIYSPGDPTILLSKSGSTLELERLVPILKELGSPLIGILGVVDSPLGRAVDHVIDASVEFEADPLNLAPTASSTTALSIGDALASALMHIKKFSATDFAKLHPAGQLGRNLHLQVADVMHPSLSTSFLPPYSTLKEVVISMTKHPLGAACIVDEANHLIGIITDGDLRRVLQKDIDIRSFTAQEIMTRDPIVIHTNDLLFTAVNIMEKRRSQISVLPVVSDNSDYLGLLRIHDIYQGDR